MSLSDHLRYLRALAGGVTTSEIAEAIGLEKVSPINLAEIQYRPVRDANLVAQLAAYYEQPLAEFEWHNARPRKYLTFYVARALREDEPVSLVLRFGEKIEGKVAWWDLSSIGVADENGRLRVVQRHAVVDWPGAATEWEDV